MAARTPETIVKDRFKAMVKKIRELRGYHVKLVYNAGESYGDTTLDVTGVIAGWPVVVELKKFAGMSTGKDKRKGQLTGRQKLDLNEFARAGALTWVVDSEEKFNTFFGWMLLLSPAPPPALTWDQYYGNDSS